ncbi:hypothetical protein BpHYR1_019365 [Brachionus plicatilis]|uniref:Uncharacterized protein n=1 Tax=Brachionus plicatilis TaxID=10195 RepID=A0A3M7PX71_BRAPC|nr:hypothetical protein BpHYR1_019365 [Brachionus plicatilis]
MTSLAVFFDVICRKKNYLKKYLKNLPIHVLSAPNSLFKKSKNTVNFYYSIKITILEESYNGQYLLNACFFFTQYLTIPSDEKPLDVNVTLSGQVQIVDLDDNIRAQNFSQEQKKKEKNKLQSIRGENKKNKSKQKKSNRKEKNN